MADEQTQIRIAENEVTFRRANEAIREAAESLELERKIPFICECPDTLCTETVLLTLAEYGRVRSDPRGFFVVPGHEATTVETGSGVVQETRDDHVLLEKVGLAGDVAEERFRDEVSPPT